MSRLAEALKKHAPVLAVSNTTLTPAQRCERTLQDNIKLLHDPDYKVNTPHGKRPPVSCIRRINAKHAEVSIIYKGKPVVLARNEKGMPIHNGLSAKVEKPEDLNAAIEDTINDLIDIINEGEVDVELQRMFDEDKKKGAV